MPLYLDVNVPWPDVAPPAVVVPSGPPPLLSIPEGERGLLRNYGDVMYWLPEMTPFRYGDTPDTEKAVLEFGDSVPRPRTFLRRFLGALSEPITRASDQLDRLPERMDPANAQDAWAAWMLRTVGFPATQDLPGWAARGLVRRMAELMPVGRTEGYLVLAECAFGRGTRSYEEDGMWSHRRTATPGGLALTISERLLNPSRQRYVRVMLAGDVPEWFVRQVRLYRNAFFSAEIVVSQNGGTSSQTFGTETLLGDGSVVA